MAATCQPFNDDVFGPAVHGCRSNFDFTLLFEQSVLSIGPTALLLLFAPLRLARLARSGRKTLPSRLRSSKAVSKILWSVMREADIMQIVALLLIGVQFVLLIFWSSNRVTRVTVPSAVLSFLATFAILILSRLEHSRSVRPSFILSVYLLASVIFDTVQVHTLFLRHDKPMILGFFTANIVIKSALLCLESKSKRRYLRAPYNHYSPEATSGIFSRSFFWWINPILAAGFRKLITLDDLFATDSSLKSEALLSEIQTSWSRYRSSGKYGLVYAVFHCLRWHLASILLPRLCLIGFNYSQPFLIASAIDYVSQPGDSRNRNDGYGLIAATGLIYFGIAITTTHYKHRVNRTITSFRGAMVSIIYAKTLELPAGLYDQSAALTLMSTDVDRLASSLDSLNEIWARIIEMSIGIWLLERQLGWVCVAPIVVVAFTVFASAHVAKRIGPRQAQWVKAIQRRIGITSSMLGSMNSVKMMGLSKNLFDILDDHRIEELNLSKHFRMMSLWRILLSFVPPIVGPLACFVIFAIQSSGQGSDRLTAGKTFSSLAIISLLTAPASSFLQSLPMVGMSTGCLHRIQKFLLSESCVDDRSLPTVHLHHTDSRTQTEGNSTELQEYQRRDMGNLAATLTNANIPPSPNSPITLHNINVQIKKGSLTMIVGVVGAGKSTLLKAIIGELKCDAGTIEIESEHMSYCAQTPWLPNSTVKQIICGYPNDPTEDEEWYTTVLHACALDEDVRLLPDHDDTIIGSRGVTLSGGQKQRLALARAVYSRLNVMVLDDVLSAIDARTENLVVGRLFGKTGILRRLNSTVILATHAVRHLPLADNVIVLSADGRIVEQGAFEKLRSQNEFVSNLLLHPELLETKSHAQPGVSDDINSETKSPPNISKVLQEAIDNDFADLTRRIGDFSVYKYYLKSIGWQIALANAALCCIWTLAQSFPPLWLIWYANGTVTSLPLFSSIYLLAAVLTLCAISSTLWTLYMNITPKSGVGLHRILLKSVMRAPQSFFDKTDSGITLNRFSQDMTLIDGPLPNAAVMALTSMLACLAQLALIAIGSTYMVFTCLLLVLVIYFLQKFYLRTSRQMRFLDLESKSPLYTHFAETLEGLSTIRAFGWQRHFTDVNLENLDISQRPYYLLFCIQRWFSLFLLLLIGGTAVAVVALATSLVGSTSPGRLGASLSSVVGFNSSLGWLMLFWTQLETSLGAIARLKSFEEGTVSEDKEAESFVPTPDWPSRGAIQFTGVSASYGESTPALRDVSFNIHHGEKVGICGRTGRQVKSSPEWLSIIDNRSGKSSLLSVLLRVLDNSFGTIAIDNLDLSTIPRDIIRSRIVTIPQEPFTLSGSVRLNADPGGLVSDDFIISVLTKVGLWTILEPRGGLDAEMKATPLSQGQQQIFCLARAMLRKGNKILVLDEATSNVDAETDGALQRLIKEEFADWTIVTVAHRLDTILDSDRILVLDKGVIVENGSPEELIAMKGAFWELSGRT